MSEMEWEDSPDLEVAVPRVRNWWTPLRYGLFAALLRWPRHVWVPLWFVPIMWVLGFLWAATLWAFSLALLVPYGIWAIAECCTYQKRRTRALMARWGPYMAELYDQDPPPQTA
jgi:hypothetical protein